MLLRLLSIESTRMSRRWLPWIALGLCVAYTGLNQYSFYAANELDILSGVLELPALSFDLANPLNQVLPVVLPFIVIAGAALMGDDFAQHTNQHWLIRAPRSRSILAKFTLLTLLILCLHALTAVAGAALGLALKHHLYGTAGLLGINIAEALWAPVNMTIVMLPYAALMLVLALLTRSTVVSSALGFIYALLVETLVGRYFHDALWVSWLPRNLYLSATFRLNAIANQVVAVPAGAHDPLTAVAIAALYTAFLVALAIWIYRRQDVGG